MKPLVCPDSRTAWREWLQEHHASSDEVWLVYYKKHTGRPTITYRDSVEEAICFGWIDGIKRRIDDQRYSHRFTPRRPGSRWSPLNEELAERMIADGTMTPAGLEAFERRKSYDHAILQSRGSSQVVLVPEIERALRANPVAWDNFVSLAPSYRRQYTGWLNSAVRPETRQKRVREALQLLRQNKKLGMK